MELPPFVFHVKQQDELAMFHVKQSGSDRPVQAIRCAP